MNQKELDRILGSEEEVLPSSGFAALVMDAVREEASAPPPIPFPWRRLLPGLAGALLGVGVLLARIVLQEQHVAEVTPPVSMFAPMLQMAERLGLQWIALAGVITLAALWFPLRRFEGESLTG